MRDAKESACSWTWATACTLNFDVARKVLDQELPDGVSTDGHRGNRAGPVYDLPTTMAKLMALGFSLNQVVEMATVNAAKLLGRSAELGFIRVGSPLIFPGWRSVSGRPWILKRNHTGTTGAGARTPFETKPSTNPCPSSAPRSE